jgi:hypothetical protein
MEHAAALLDIGHVEQAHVDLCHAIEQTPTDSPCYAAMIGAANWIHPLEQPKTALKQLAKALHILDDREAHCFGVN